MTDLHGQIEDLRNEVRDIKEDIRAVRALLDGGQRPADGLIVRLDRLEQRGFGALKAWWMILAGFVGALSSYLTSLLNKP